MWNASAVRAPPRISAIGVAPRSSACASDSTTTTPRALAEHEPVARPVERPRGRLGRVVALRQRAHVRERGHAHRHDGRLGAAGQDHVALAGRDQPERVVEGDDRRRAGGDLGDDRTGQAVLHRQQAAAPIEPDRAGIANGRDEARALRVVGVGAVDDLLDPAAAGVDDDADPVPLVLRPSPRSRCPTTATASFPAPIARWMNRLMRRAILASIDGRGVEVDDLGRDLDLEARGVERADPARAGHARCGGSASTSGSRCRSA